MELIVSRFQGRNGLDRPKGVQEARNALMNGNWNDVERFFHQHGEEAFKFKLTASGETALHVAIKGRRHRQGFFFIRKLIEIYPSDLLAEMDNSGNTALHAVAQLGNVKTACLLVNKSHILLSLLNDDQLLPIQVAANRGRKEMTSYLLTISMTDGVHGARVLQSLVNARYCDLALKLLESNPKLAWEDICPLELMAEDPSVFPSGTYFGIWESLIYTLCPETPGRLWKILEVLVPRMKRVHHKKLMHRQAVQLVTRICSNTRTSETDEASSVLKRSLFLGVQNGVEEIVTEILDSFPASIDFTDEEKHSVFHLAVMYRHEKVFKALLKKNIEHDRMFLTDNNGNNILHLAGHLARQDLLDLNGGAILQMQYELRWFKELERIVSPKEIKSKNVEGKTPLAIFNEEHFPMAQNEIKWMTGMATACSVVASLIATVAFAAAITVPGGNNNSNGLPIFSNQTSFLVFAISDSLALVSSITTVLSFLSIFTSRFGVKDFLNTLPSRLIIGQISLLFSVISLMVAFSATIFLMYAKQNVKNVLFVVPIITIACAPVTFFIKLQLPPLLNMIKSTYVPDLFG